ncbi:hypothetical protein E6Q11_02465 [Candidatus Dojkabacteria bacterium]|uniref:3'-5' exonuclease domain-containing protein n=1 Tax=Candidatus Dojkabacteria bacterium TaxID=2099670 RepID=A0A5C7J9G5_9BACT|nr:MAG: hypothetical protein E6Q11_02465 [Candidatus Dojkabacteria bacterium]
MRLPKVYLDFETRSMVDLKRSGVHVYAEHESTDILCMAYAIDDGEVKLWQNWREYPRDLATLHFSGEPYQVVAHNAAFEATIWREVGHSKYGWPFLEAHQWHCTMAMAYAMALPGSLERAAAAVGIDKQKDMKGHRTMMQLSQPRSVAADGTPTWWEDSEKFEKLHEYCRQDVEVERELYKRLLRLSEREKNIWQLDQEINRRGVSVDLTAVKKALALAAYEKNRLNEEMREVTKNQVATCNANAQLTAWIENQGIDLKGVAKSDVLELLNNVSLPADVRRALLLRQEAAKSSTAKLEAMMESVSKDGRIRGLFQYHGAGTGRWAGRRVQLQNLPRPQMKTHEIEEVFKILNAT